MKVWITGARGFIGQHLARYISLKGHDVAGIGHGLWDESDRNFGCRCEWLNGDISQVNLDVLLEKHGTPDAIFHLAGGSSVGPSVAMPLKDMYRSVNSTSELLEWVRLNSKDTSVIMASSAAVYGAGHLTPINENTNSKPYSPYGYHKRMAELLVESYASNFGLKTSIVRLFSVYGSGLRKQLLWDACSRLARGANDIQFGGSGNELRDWIHVEDASEILWRALEHASSECFIVNGGTGIATSVKQITETLFKKWGLGIEPTFSRQSRSGDPTYLVASTTVSKKIGFEPKHEWENGIDEYVTWFKGLQ